MIPSDWIRHGLMSWVLFLFYRVNDIDLVMYFVFSDDLKRVDRLMADNYDNYDVDDVDDVENCDSVVAEMDDFDVVESVVVVSVVADDDVVHWMRKLIQQHEEESTRSMLFP